MTVNILEIGILMVGIFEFGHKKWHRKNLVATTASW
jgi:hypothetical protein